MSGSDQKVRREILQYVFEEFKQAIPRDVNFNTLADNIEETDRDNIIYQLERLADNSLIETQGAVGQRISRLSITPEGVEKLDRDGYDTFLADDTRYALLNIIYEVDRDNHGNAGVFIERDSLTDDIDITDQQLELNLWYLKEKDIIEQRGGRRNIRITSHGRNRYEEYQSEGIPIPRTKQLTRWAQYAIAQGDIEKAENVFRDLAELTREELIIVDPFAKGKLYTMLEDTPDIVDIKILTTNREAEDDENIDLYHDLRDSRTGNTELRYLNYRGEWSFHDRLLFRDREEGWVWGHTFADSGSKHHTISQMRPVNVEGDLEKFDTAWEDAKVIE